MSVGTWEPPGQKKHNNIELSLIKRFLSFAESADFEHNLAYADFRSAELNSLARLFTILERDLSGWEGGKFCPVIYIVKELRKRGESISELKRWIKTHSTNRYLPYGSAI
jgi:hypothetical protein